MKTLDAKSIRAPGYYIYQQENETALYAIDFGKVMQMGSIFTVDLTAEDFPGWFYGPLDLEEIVAESLSK